MAHIWGFIRSKTYDKDSIYKNAWYHFHGANIPYLYYGPLDDENTYDDFVGDDRQAWSNAKMKQFQYVVVKHKRCLKRIPNAVW